MQYVNMLVYRSTNAHQCGVVEELKYHQTSPLRKTTLERLHENQKTHCAHSTTILLSCEQEHT